MNELWGSVVVTVVGKTAVFVFLAVLVFLMWISGLLCTRWSGKAVEATDEEVAAIAAAVRAYWQIHQRR